MPAVLAIPLVAVSAPTITAGVASALKAGAFLGSAVTAAVGTRLIIDKLTPTSTPAQLAQATNNFLKAEQDFEAARAAAFGKIASADMGKEIAKNYPYVEWDDKSNKLAVATDSTLAAGGDLLINRESNNISVQNSIINTQIPFINYGTDDIPLAVTRETAVNVALSDDGVLPLIVNKTVVPTDAQAVAETVLAADRIELNNRSTTFPTAPLSSDVIGSTIPGVVPVDATDIIFGDIVRPQSQDLIDPALTAELARETSRARAWSEDAATTADAGSVAKAGSLEQARALERQDAAAIAATSPGLPTMPTGTSGLNQNSSSTNSNYNASTSAKKINSGGVVSRSVEYPEEKPNALHNYVNYTYKISMYMIPKDAMNQISQGLINPGGEDAILSQGQLILSSGGSKSSDKGTYFKEDFYIDNLEFSSIPGSSSVNRSTDVIGISFDIVEPYNITLLPRLVAAVTSLTGKPDWGMAFYIFKIQFLGYDDNGSPVEIPKTTKYIPFMIGGIEFDVTTRGTVYRIKGLPTAHYAQTILDNIIPFHMEISGGTVDELFNSSATFAPSANQAGGGRVSEVAAAAQSKNSGPQTFTKGVSDALNAGEEYLKKTGSQKFANTYKFEFTDELKNAKVIDPQTYNILGLRFSNKKDPKEQSAAAPPPVDLSKNVFRVQAGTRITDFVSSILQVSSYITDQYAAKPPQDKPLYLWKIIPLVKFGEYDVKTKIWQRDITYSVVPYTIYGQNHPNFGQKAPPGATKRFKWLFTGQSKDIIDVKISYQSAFITILNGAEKALLEGDGQDDQIDSDQDGQTGVFPTRSRPVFGIADFNNTGPRTLNKKTLAVEELFKKQFDADGDNLKIQITITGDPDLIQQDNVMHGKGNPNQLIYDSGSLNFVHYEAYFWLDFKSPYKDYKENDGLMDLASSNTNFFSGLYKILKVTSRFTNGKFTQSLDNFRVKIQSNTGNQEERTARGNRAESSTMTSMVQDDTTGVDAAIAQRQADRIAQTPTNVVESVSADTPALPVTTQQLINNNPGDPNVPTSPFG
jgi:hypothetical protein